MKTSGIIIVMVLFALNLPMKGQVYRVLTYNIRYDNPADNENAWPLRKDELAETILDLHPAIVGLQEALSSQVDFLSEKWNAYKYYGVGREDGRTKGEMVPIFYDTTVFHLISSRTIWLSETADIPSKGWDAACERVAALVGLEDVHSKDTLWVVNTHWDHVGVQARANSAEAILKLLQPLMNKHQRFILMGDFNAKPNEESIKKISSRLEDTCPLLQRKKGTFNGFQMKPKHPARIDYVFVSSKKMKKKSYRVLHPVTKSKRQLSDHFPILVRLKAHE